MIRITTTRRLCQAFFLLLFCFFCLASSLGEAWYQLRGWPVNGFLHFDPLVTLTTFLATGQFYGPLIWGVLTLVVTLLLGRVFCGWFCPFGTLHHLISFLATRHWSLARKIRTNRYYPAQRLKYYLLFFFLLSAAWGLFFPEGSRITGAVQSGFLDPIPFFQRSLNLILLPLSGLDFSLLPRYYANLWPMGLLFLAAILANLFIPRFYCRFICPLGGLLGLLSSYALFRPGQALPGCQGCDHCGQACQTGAEPGKDLQLRECIVCLNCLPDCPHPVMGYGPHTQHIVLHSPDLQRRELILTLGSSLFTLPVLRLQPGPGPGPSWNPALIRPPGALNEVDFLKRCLKCGQCMRICPVNIIQPAGLEGGIEGLWTPMLQFRQGSSGCQLNCIACGHLCPSAAIRPLSLAEKRGLDEFQDRGPIRMGLAFIERGRCLPWSMQRPCIVCQENCPVSPKAIKIRTHYEPLYSRLRVEVKTPTRFQLRDPRTAELNFNGSDYVCRPSHALESMPWVTIQAITPRRIETLTPCFNPSASTDPLADIERSPAPDQLDIALRLQRPWIDLNHCIGCGICEHECPVQGKPAIRVSAENESRHPTHRLALKTQSRYS